MASLPSILILGADSAAAASPATPVQLVHACRRWGFSAVVPASWGDELIATEVIRRCAARSNRPVVQCSCPRVAERLGQHAPLLDDSVLWLVPPAVAVAKYLRAIESERDIHVTYAGACPGAADPSIDQWISPYELLAALSSRGIDLLSQPTVFEDIIPADGRRHASSPGGLPEQHQLWEGATFRVAQPTGGDLPASIAQLLLTEDRLLIDLSPSLGCVCRASQDSSSETALVRSPSAIVIAGKVDVSRPAPVLLPPPPQTLTAPAPKSSEQARAVPDASVAAPAARTSPGRPVYRRQSTWRRQSPRPGVVVARTSGIMLAVKEPVPLLRRPETAWMITAIVATLALIIALWAGRRGGSATRSSVGSAGFTPQSPSTQIARSRSPSSHPRTDGPGPRSRGS